jgi:acyl carrier protein
VATGSENDELKLELKKIIIEACEKELAPEDIGDTDTLVGFGSKIELDSLDVLQINVALANRYKVRIEDSKHARRVMKNVNALADFVQPAADTAD